MRRLLVLVSLLLVGCSHGSYPQAEQVIPAEQAVYRLNAGDMVMVHVFDEADMTGQYKIDSRGMIALPLIGKVSVQNKTEQQAAQVIAHHLQSGGFLRQPKVTVEIANARPFFILGEVINAGKYSFQDNLTVYQAVAIAGGFTYRADRDDIVISRQTGKGPGTEKRLSAKIDTPVLPGDVIDIGERFF